MANANKVDQLAKILPTSWDSGSAIHYSKLTDAVNGLLGYNGPSVISNSLDVQGNPVQNVANPKAATDALNLQTADAKYASSVQSKALDVGGTHTLTGLNALYLQSSKGLSVTITTAKLTPTGTNGSMTFSKGLLISAVQST